MNHKHSFDFNNVEIVNENSDSESDFIRRLIFKITHIKILDLQLIKKRTFSF